MAQICVVVRYQGLEPPLTAQFIEVLLKTALHTFGYEPKRLYVEEKDDSNG